MEVDVTTRISAVSGAVRDFLRQSVSGPAGHRGLAAIVLLAACFATGMAYAQVTTATVYGIVQDLSGGAIPGATVTVTNESTSAKTSAVTNERGEFTITFLPVGTYALSIEAAGFKLFTRTGLELKASQKAHLVLTLEVGALTE